MLKAYIFRITFIVCVVLITFLSLAPLDVDIDPNKLQIPHLDKYVHFCFYFAFAVTGSLACKELLQMRLLKKSELVKVFSGAVVYGIIIEIFQTTLTATRQADILDVAANTSGALIGIIAVWCLKATRIGLK